MTEQTGAGSARERWQQRYAQALAQSRVRDADFTTLSGVEVDPVYGPADESWTVTRLRAEARARGVAGYSRKTKAQLLADLAG